MITTSSLLKVPAEGGVEDTGSLVGETIMMYVPSSHLWDQLTTGDKRLEIETDEGTEIFVSRHDDQILPTTLAYYNQFKETDYVSMEAGSNNIDTYASKTPTLLMDTRSSSNWISRLSVFTELKGYTGMVVTKSFDIYLFCLFDNPDDITTNKLCVFKCTPEGPDSTKAVLVWTSPDEYKFIYYSDPIYFERYGVENILFFGAGNSQKTPFLMTLSEDGISVSHNRGLRKQFPMPRNTPSYKSTTGGVRNNENSCDFNSTHQIKNTLVSEMIFSNASLTTLSYQGRLHYSHNGLQWEQIPEEHFTDPGHPGYFGSSTRIFGFFNDEVNDRLCCVCRPTVENWSFIIYYTDNGVNWVRGLTLRSDAGATTFSNDSSDSNRELGDDTTERVKMCGKVLYYNGYWYVGWANITSNGDGNVEKMAFCRFDDYTTSGTVESIASRMDSRECLQTWNSSGPPSLLRRSAVATGIISVNDEWVALMRPDEHNHTLDLWYFDGEDSVGWYDYDGYTYLPEKVIPLSDLPTYFAIAKAAEGTGAVVPDFSSISDYECRTKEVADCYDDSGAAVFSDITIQEMIWNTYPVSSPYKNMFYSIGTLKGKFALNFTNDKFYMDEGANFILKKIPGYTSAWNFTLPLTRVD